MMENHSFDDHLGTLGRGDGLTLGPDGKPVNYNPDPSGGYVRSFHNPNTCGESDSGISQIMERLAHVLGQRHQHGLRQGVQRRGHGLLGRARTFPSTIPWPVSSPSATATSARSWPRRTRIAASSSPAPRSGNIRTDVTGISKVDAPNGTIFDRLNEYGISWKDYYPDLPTCALFEPVFLNNPTKSRPHDRVLRRRGVGEPSGVQPGRPLHQLLRGGRGHLGG